MSMMLLLSNLNQKYPMRTQNSHRAAWPIIIPRIILEFKSNWDYVDPENVPVNADNTEVLENTFEEEEVDIALHVAQEEQSRTLFYEQQFLSTEQFLQDSHLPPALFRSEQMKKFANRTNQMTKMVFNRLTRPWERRLLEI